MANDNKYINNVQTGEVLVVELSDDEQTLRDKEIKENVKIAAKAEAEAEAKVLAKSELLAKLGITEDEAKLLLS